jgi:alcohol dehydrogenase (NADP+)
MQIERRTLGPNDVLLDILNSAICHSDVHHVYDDWGTLVYGSSCGRSWGIL